MIDVNDQNLQADELLDNHISGEKISEITSEVAEEGRKILSKNVENSIWLSVSEAAKIGGVQTKTIRRAIQSRAIRYKVVKNRYFIDIASIIRFLISKTKLRNKFNQYGIGQYIDKWKK